MDGHSSIVMSTVWKPRLRHSRSREITRCVNWVASGETNSSSRGIQRHWSTWVCVCVCVRVCVCACEAATRVCMTTPFQNYFHYVHLSGWGLFCHMLIVASHKPRLHTGGVQRSVAPHGKWSRGLRHQRRWEDGAVDGRLGQSGILQLREMEQNRMNV